jgi:hypothetical protein
MSTKKKVRFYKGEDGLALEARFMEIHKRFSKINTYSDDEIALVVFEGLRDARTRAPEAAIIWGEAARTSEAKEKLLESKGSAKEYFEDEALQKKYDELEEMLYDCEKDYLKYRIRMEQIRMIEEEGKRKAEAAKNNPSTDICGLPIFEIVERAS